MEGDTIQVGDATVESTAAPIEMSVATHHPEYDEMLDEWKKIRDVLEGQSAVKEAGEDYLPMPDGQDKDDYKAYKERALFYGAVKRTLNGMTGMVFMTPPEIENQPEEDIVQLILDDITFTGVPMYGFAKSAFKEVMGMGRVGIWVDMPQAGSPEMRPYMVMYETENIINWRRKRINGKMVTTLVVLTETYEEPYEEDPFLMNTDFQFRVLSLDQPQDAEGNPILNVPLQYTVRVYRPLVDESTKKSSGYQLWEGPIVPTRNGTPLEFIPFVMVGPDSITFNIQSSPMLDMVDVVLSHYQNSADLENARHWCGLPQPYAVGFPDRAEYKIGGNEIWVSTDASAKAGFMELTGQSMAELRLALEEKEAKLAVLGMRLLESQKKAAEQPEALRLRMLGDSSVLQSVARTVGQGITLALQWALQWAIPASAADTMVTLNQDYGDESMNAQDFTALVTMWQSNGISYRTLYSNLTAAGIAREGVDADEELEEIQIEQEQALANAPVAPEEQQPQGTGELGPVDTNIEMDTAAGSEEI